jgi:preprotein translocase subunit SecA
MTNQEAAEIVKNAFQMWESEYGMTGEDWSEEHKACEMAVNALESQTVEDIDCISRDVTITMLSAWMNDKKDYRSCLEVIKDVPPAKQKVVVVAQIVLDENRLKELCKRAARNVFDRLSRDEPEGSGPDHS